MSPLDGFTLSPDSVRYRREFVSRGVQTDEQVELFVIAAHGVAAQPQLCPVDAGGIVAGDGIGGHPDLSHVVHHVFGKNHLSIRRGVAALDPFADGRAVATIQRAERAMNELGMYNPFLIVYYGSDGCGGWQPLNRPLRTITTLDRFGLVTWRGCEPMLRMLQPSELAAAMGFGSDFSLDHVVQRRDKVKLLGNGVAPPVMEAIVRALTSSEERIESSQRLWVQNAMRAEVMEAA